MVSRVEMGLIPAGWRGFLFSQSCRTWGEGEGGWWGEVVGFS